MALAGCSSSAGLREYVPQIVTPYRIDIQQGNFVTLDMVDKLQAGQTKDQVRFILGTPMLTDVFHQERWDFIFRSAKGWNEPEKRRLTVFFDKAEKLEKWEAVDVPKAVDVAAPAPAEPPGFFSGLFGRGKADAAAATASGAAAPAGAVAGASNVSTAATDPTPVSVSPTPALTSAPTTPSASAANTPAAEPAPGFFGRLFGRGKSDAGAPPVVSATGTSAAPPVPVPAPQPAPVAAVASAPVVQEPVVVTPPPSAAPPAPATSAGTASGADDKPGIFGRMFGWMRPGSGTAVAAVPAAAAGAAPAPASAVVAPPLPPSPVVAAAPIAVAQAVATPVAAPVAAAEPPAAVPVPTPTPALVLAPKPAPVATPRVAAGAAPAIVAAPAAAAPPASAASFEAPPAVRAAITIAIDQWRQAWSSKNSAAYIASYEPQFKSTGLTRAEWQAQRTDRIKRAASISVTVSDVKMAQETDGAVAVSFVQKYESPTFKETGRKLLVFGNYNGQWLIREESFLANSK